jgi:hypothetical protein
VARPLATRGLARQIVEVAQMRDRYPSRLAALVAGISIVVGTAGVALGSTPAGDVRLSNDSPSTSGYVSDYTLVTGTPYTDPALTECSRSRGRQNEPAVAVNPRNTQVIVGSSNDYCAVYDDGVDADGAPIASGPIWLGYYRSTNGGGSFTSSLVPGYPGDTSPFAARAQIRTASSGDPVLAWDNEGRLFAGSESSDDPAGTLKTFGDVWVATYENPDGVGGDTSRDGLEFKRSVIVARGVSAPFLLGKFQDKTAIEADRTSSSCEGNVYFANSRFVGNGGSNIYFYRSTDHGKTFSHGTLLTKNVNDVQDPDIAVTANGHVYVTINATLHQGNQTVDAILYARSTDCGATFEPTRVLTTYVGYNAQDIADPQPTPASPPDDELEAEVEQGTARDCGDFDAACESGYTFFRHTSSPRSTADQLADPSDETVYVVLNMTIPGTEVPTGTTFGTIEPGTGSQSGAYFMTLNGATGDVSEPVPLDPISTGHQLWPDISADGGVLHTLWWDSRNDACYSRTRPISNCADRTMTPGLDVFASSSTDGGATWTAATRVSDVTTMPNYEQFGGRTVPFGGDYLWISSVGQFSFGTWTDWRNTVAGVDQREAAADDNDTGADVLQCRIVKSDGSHTGDLCPRDGGLDQNIYGDLTP